MRIVSPRYTIRKRRKSGFAAVVFQPKRVAEHTPSYDRQFLKNGVYFFVFPARQQKYGIIYAVDARELVSVGG